MVYGQVSCNKITNLSPFDNVYKKAARLCGASGKKEGVGQDGDTVRNGAKIRSPTKAARAIPPMMRQVRLFLMVLVGVTATVAKRGRRQIR